MCKGDTCNIIYKTSSNRQQQLWSVATKLDDSCIRVSRHGPDTTELAMSRWVNIAMHSIMFSVGPSPSQTPPSIFPNFVDKAIRMKQNLGSSFLVVSEHGRILWLKN